MSKPNNITVIDSLMGTGKTSYAIQMMKEAHESQKFIYITPFLTEVERITEALPEKSFKTPTNRNSKGSKLEGLKKLLTTGSNIASTHALWIVNSFLDNFFKGRKSILCRC